MNIRHYLLKQREPVWFSPDGHIPQEMRISKLCQIYWTGEPIGRFIRFFTFTASSITRTA